MELPAQKKGGDKIKKYSELLKRVEYLEGQVKIYKDIIKVLLSMQDDFMELIKILED